MDARDLITIARDWPADKIDRAVILDLADALEAALEREARFNPGLADLLTRRTVFEESPVVPPNSGQEVTAND